MLKVQKLMQERDDKEKELNLVLSRSPQEHWKLDLQALLDGLEQWEVRSHNLIQDLYVSPHCEFRRMRQPSWLLARKWSTSRSARTSQPVPSHPRNPPSTLTAMTMRVCVELVILMLLNCVCSDDWKPSTKASKPKTASAAASGVSLITAKTAEAPKRAAAQKAAESVAATIDNDDEDDVCNAHQMIHACLLISQRGLCHLLNALVHLLPHRRSLLLLPAVLSPR